MDWRCVGESQPPSAADARSPLDEGAYPAYIEHRIAEGI